MARRKLHHASEEGDKKRVRGEKVRAIYVLHSDEYRDVVDQPLFFLAIAAIIIGVQLFLAGFIGEMIVQNNTRKSEYSIEETIGLD